MPSKLRKAIGVVKDHTSIGIAKVSKTAAGSASQLDVLVLKATSHDEVMVEEKYVAEMVQITAMSRGHAAACVQAISRRIDRTSSWIVALKCLQLVFRALQDGGPYFDREALNAMRRGSRLLNLSGFCDDSTTTTTTLTISWDYTAFVRTMALYLDERLDSVLLGKVLRRRPTTPNHNRLRGVKPSLLLDRLPYWQSLLDRAIATCPTRSHSLVLHSFRSVVLESFDLYKDVADAVVVLIDAFFAMPRSARVDTYHACVRVARQLKELSAFYNICRSIGVGKPSEFPHVQKISRSLLKALREFIKPTPEKRETDDRLRCTVTELVLFEDDVGRHCESGSENWEHELVKTARDISTRKGSHKRSFSDVLEHLSVGVDSETLRGRSSSFCGGPNPFLEENWVEPTFRADESEFDEFASRRAGLDPLGDAARKFVEHVDEIWEAKQLKSLV